jgi:hypothetical protein
MHTDEKEPIYILNACERAALEESAEDVRLGRFATDEKVAAIFRRTYRASPQRGSTKAIKSEQK